MHTKFDQVTRWMEHWLGELVTFGFAFAVLTLLGSAHPVTTSETLWHTFLHALGGILAVAAYHQLRRRLGDSIASTVRATVEAASDLPPREIRPQFTQFSTNFRTQATVDLGIAQSFLQDHGTEIGKGRWLLSGEGYLRFLSFHLQSSDKLYCLNRATPLEWFLPESGCLACLREYRQIAEAKRSKILRFTAVNDRERLVDQVAYFVRELQGMPGDQQIARLIIFWRVVLLVGQKRTNTDHITRFSAMLGEAVSPETYSLLFSPVPPPKDVFDCHNVELVAATAAVQNAGYADKLQDWAKTALGDAELRKEISACINQYFLDLVGDDGGYYVNRTILESMTKNDALFGGEVGFFVKANHSMTLVFSARGNLGSGITVSILPPPQGAEVIKTLETLHERSTQKPGSQTAKNVFGGIRELIPAP